MKKLLALLVSVLLLLTLLGCNQQLIDITYKFDRAMIKMPDGTVVSGRVSSWKDYEDSDAIQVVIDGVSYYTFLGNVVLIND